jgi:hypothetical protein
MREIENTLNTMHSFERVLAYDVDTFMGGH